MWRTIIVREAERLTRLINEVLDLAKIESGSMEWGMQRVDVRDLVQEAEDSVRQLFEDSEVWLGHVLPDTPLWLNGDRDRLVRQHGLHGRERGRPPALLAGARQRPHQRLRPGARNAMGRAGLCVGCRCLAGTGS